MDLKRQIAVRAALTIVVGLSLVAMAAARTQGEKTLLGWVERVWVGESRLELEAKLDTGADTSSIHATRIRRFRSQSGQRWVEFRLADAASGRTIRFKKRLVRYAYIKEHEGPSQKRPVVELTICLGNEKREVEVSLVDRSGFQYPVLLGRNALEGHVVVDPAVKLTADPTCAVRERP
jgi:hypothetical protein